MPPLETSNETKVLPLEASIENYIQPRKEPNGDVDVLPVKEPIEVEIQPSEEFIGDAKPPNKEYIDATMEESIHLDIEIGGSLLEDVSLVVSTLINDLRTNHFGERESETYEVGLGNNYLQDDLHIDGNPETRAKALCLKQDLSKDVTSKANE